MTSQEENGQEDSVPDPADDPAAGALAKASALLELGRPEQAAEAAGRGLASMPDHTELQVVLAEALVSCHRLDQAYAVGCRVAGTDPENPAVHRIMGRVLAARGDHLGALKALEYSLWLDPHDDETRINHVACLGILRRFKHAEERARAYVAEEPHSPVGHLALGVLELAQMLGVTPGNLWVFLLLAFVSSGLVLLIVMPYWVYLLLRNSVRLRRAKNHLRRALQLDPQNPLCLAVAAELMAQRGRWLTAVKTSVRAARLNLDAVDTELLRRRVRREQVISEMVCIIVVVIVYFVAAMISGFTGLATLVTVAITVSLAVTYAVHRRRSLRQILPQALWRRTAGSGMARWIGPVAVVICALTLIPVVPALRESYELDGRGLLADAVVTSVEHRDGGWSDGTIHDWTKVTVTFTDGDGVPRRAWQAGPESTRTGDRLQITYDPQNPELIRWDMSLDKRFDWLGITVTAPIVLGVGFAVTEIVTARRRRKALA